MIALSVSGLVAFAAGEIAVRMISDAPLPEREPLMEVRANEFRGYEMVPGVHYTYQHAVHVNSLGFRGPEVEPKRAGETRILTLGDSLLYGQGVADDETLAHYMQVELGADTTVINSGHRAYATHQEIGLLRELGAELEPDVVVLFWYWNDIIERPVKKTFDNLTASGPIVFDVGQRMEGATRVKWHLKQLLRRSALVMYVYDQYQARRRRGKADDPEFIQKGLKRLRHYTNQLKAESAKLNAKLLVAIIPDPASLVSEHVSEGVGRAAETIFADADVAFVNLSGPVQGLYEELGSLPVIPYDYHYQAEGNRVMAAEVVRTLRADGFK